MIGGEQARFFLIGIIKAVGKLRESTASEPLTRIVRNSGTLHPDVLFAAQEALKIESAASSVPADPRTAEFMRRLGSPVELLIECQRCIEISDRDSEALYFGARALFSLDRYEDALDFLTRARGLAPSDFRVLHLQAWALQRTGHLETAESTLKTLEKCINDLPSAIITTDLRLSFIRTSASASVFRTYTKLLSDALEADDAIRAEKYKQQLAKAAASSEKAFPSLMKKLDGLLLPRRPGQGEPGGDPGLTARA